MAGDQSDFESNSIDAIRREIGLRFNGVHRRFDAVNTRIYSAVGLLIVMLAAGGLALWSELSSLRADLAQAKADTTAVREQTADQRARRGRLDEKLDKNSAENHAIQEQVADQKARLDRLDEKLDKNSTETMRAIQETAVRIESTVSTRTPERAPPFVAMMLSDEERTIIRKFFEVRKKPYATGFEAKVGDIAPETAPLYPVPSLLFNNVPKLRGHRFFADEANGTIILVRPFDNRVVAIV